MTFIPLMTHPLSKYWEQPDASTFLFDDEYVLMTREQCERLHEYSNTRPTGTYAGKMWKCYAGKYKLGTWIQLETDTWFLCWYADTPNKPNYIDTHTRRILFL